MTIHRGGDSLIGCFSLCGESLAAVFFLTRAILGEYTTAASRGKVARNARPVLRPSARHSRTS